MIHTLDTSGVFGATVPRRFGISRMSAASPPPTGSTPVPPSGHAPAVPPADVPHHHVKTPAELAALEVQDNALYRGLKSFGARAKSGHLLPSKVLAVIVLVAVAGGLWWWFSGQSKKTESRRWAGLQNLTASDQLNAYAADNPSSTANLVARRSRALNLLAADGTEKLKSKVQVERMKAVENIEVARDELVTLAELFKKDRTLKAVCLEDAAIAERSLVGVPKAGALLADENPANSRGSVDKAADYYRQASAAIGANTLRGEKYEKIAAELTANAKTILSTNSYLYSTVAAGDVLNPQPTPQPTPGITPGTTPNPKTPATTPSPKTPTTSPK